jgi:hypothetical protein
MEYSRSGLRGANEAEDAENWENSECESAQDGVVESSLEDG